MGGGRHGASPGERRGGRAKGTKNKATIARERAAAAIEAKEARPPNPGTAITVREAARQVRSGSKLAIDVMAEFMMLFRGMAARYQPRYDGAGNQITGNESKFIEYAKLAVMTGDRLAPYQSPPIKAMPAPSPVPTPEDQPAPRPAAGGENVVPLHDPARAARVYADLMRRS